MKRKILIGFSAFFVLFFLFLVWYKIAYSMEVVEPYEVNDSNLSAKVLIATQGSEYKNKVVDGVVDHLKEKEVYIKVIDVSGLPEISPDDWHALLIIHNWEIWQPEANSEEFLKKNYDPAKMFVIVTSGAGDEKIEGVDAITGASVIEEVPEHVKAVTDWFDKTLPEE